MLELHRHLYRFNYLPEKDHPSLILTLIIYRSLQYFSKPYHYHFVTVHKPRNNDNIHDNSNSICEGMNVDNK